MTQPLKNFKGIIWTLCDNWVPFIDFPTDRPINYCEIGVLYGANLLRFAELFGSHPDTKLYAVDPWLNYDLYPEYEGKMTTIYDTFIENINNSSYLNKIIIKRDFSHNIMPKFDDNLFDIIYIDGNHEKGFILKDAIMSYEKLKNEGYIIFDDLNWKTIQDDVHEFLKMYEDKVEIFKIISFGGIPGQLICRKIA